MRYPLMLIFAIAAGPITASADRYTDTARVLDSQPVYAARSVPVQVEECGYSTAAATAIPDPASLGDARAVDPGTDLLGALQKDIALREPPPPVYRCQNVTRMQSKNVLAGYRVRYEYQGRVYERQLADHPGETIEVSVRMRADVARFR